MPTIAELLGSGPGSIEQVIKVAPAGVALDPNKTQGRHHRQLLKDMIAALIANQTDYPPTPAGISWVTRPTVTLTGTTINLSAGEADFEGTATSFQAVTIPTTLPASGKLRQDVVVALSSGYYQYLKGSEGTSVVTPNVPNGALFVAYLLFSAQGGQVQQPAELPTDPTPVLLTDAATVTFNTDTGKIRENAALTLTGQLQTLVVSNTKAGYFYQVRLKNCTGQQVTLSPVSGVSYVGLDGQAMTTVTLPASGDCMLSYYHASATERVIELLDGGTGTGTGGDYLPLTFPDDQEVIISDKELAIIFNTPTTWGRATIDHESFDYFRYRSENSVVKSHNSTRIFDDIGQAQTTWDWISENEQYKVEKGLFTSPTQGYSYIRITAKATSAVTEWQFRQDGKLYINGTEFTGGGSGGTVTVDSALSGTSENPVQNKVVKAALDTLRPTGLTTFAATNTFDRNKVMKLGGTGDAFTANHVLNNAASGNLMDTTLTVLVTGNGTNTVSLEASWKNENGGAFDTTNGKKNVIRLHYIDSNNKFFTISQPV
jgi:hypothetical protein